MFRFAESFLSERVLSRCESWTHKLPLNLLQREPTKVNMIRVMLPSSARCKGLEHQIESLAEAWSGIFEQLWSHIDVQIYYPKG